jgi:hypothetical protein
MRKLKTEKKRESDSLLVNDGHHEGTVTVSLEAGQRVQVGNEGRSSATVINY